ncbi:uncharacterized protein N0V96_009608 [Colletotrichum fioriniae]|uniref:uncharacterized protein n=1 Tax=Colletotrichum fioriniae TaxID=710243 RepID=UPI0032DB5209|nr:hypothetical protein N0V96_009608 [Colletotrichum fioriniae]
MSLSREELAIYQAKLDDILGARELGSKWQELGVLQSAQHFGIPWANIVDFSDKQPDEDYPFRFDFDGLFEQVHDNFHGWVGNDMADNTYTAFDPIFLSYHANMDRLAGVFMDANPENQFTSRFPLQPYQ